MALGDKIRERELRPQHILVASILAGLNEMGMINQASVNVASRRAGRYLADYTKATGRSGLAAEIVTRAEKIRALVEKLDELLELGTRVRLGATTQGIEIAIISMGCKFCPKGVGEAELKGALCPYPGLVEEYVNGFLEAGEKVKLLSINRRQLRKIDDQCYIVLR
jgi:hypothetical protein